MTLCSVDGCPDPKSPKASHGMCSAHYQQFRRTGKVHSLRKTVSTRERFISHVDMSGDCWIWTGVHDRHGYGRFGLSSKSEFRDESGMTQVGAHQFARAMDTGKWPELQTLHTCDVRNCVNPEHLYEGTVKDNVRDKVVRGRTPALEQHGRARLTAQDVKDLRDRKVSVKEMAKLRGVSKSTCYHARTGRNWKSLQ